MKNLWLVFLIYFCGLNFSLAQGPIIKRWDKRFGGNLWDNFGSIQQTFDGGYILAGKSNSDISGDKSQPSQGSYDYWIIKLDSSGNKQWDKRYGGDSDDELNCIQQTADHGYIIGGSSSSGQSGDKTQPGWGDTDFWIVKTDSLGIKQWDKRYGGNLSDILKDIQQTADGGYILGGLSSSQISGDKSEPNFGNSDYWVIKVDAQGIKQWDRDFGGDWGESLSVLRQTKDGGYILAGGSASDSSGNKSQNVWQLPSAPHRSDYWIVKIDSSGNKQWDKDYGGFEIDYLFSIDLTNNGGYILGGTSLSGIGGDKTQPLTGNAYQSDYWIIKIDSTGNFEWDRSYGGSDYDIYLETLIQTSDKGYLMAGTSMSQMSGDKSENNLGTYQTWVVKTDSLGNKQWDKTLLTYNSHQLFTSGAIETADGCYAVANTSDSGIGGDKTQASWGHYDYWMIKYCINPVKLTSSDTVFCGKQYIDFYDHSTNNPTSWQWFFPGGIPSTSTQQNPAGIYYNTFGSFDVTLIACNGSLCDTLYLPNFIKEFPDPPPPVIIWTDDTLFSTPAYSYQWYFNSGIIPGATGQYYVFQQPGNYFVIITDSNGCSAPSFAVYTGIDEINGVEIKVSPNPSDGNFMIYGAPYYSTISIFDVNGRCVHKASLNSSEANIILKVLDGVYFLEIAIKNAVIRNKIIIRN